MGNPAPGSGKMIIAGAIPCWRGGIDPDYLCGYDTQDITGPLHTLSRWERVGVEGEKGSPALLCWEVWSQTMDGLLQDLQKRIAGEVRFDPFSRMLYSTDASIYQIEPIGVVLPRHADDVAATVEVARQHGVPVLPRGGGTGLAGQTIGQAIIIDMSNYMHQITELNTEEHWAWVQPGVVQDQLNAYLRPHGFLFGPDTSTSSRATIGGMTGNNSAGARSVIYGKTIDHVLE